MGYTQKNSAISRPLHLEIITASNTCKTKLIWFFYGMLCLNQTIIKSTLPGPYLLELKKATVSISVLPLNTYLKGFI